MRIIVFFFIFCLFILSKAGATTNILFLGDSLTEGLGVDESQAFPRLVEKILREKKYDIAVTNGGVSGATSASGEARLIWHLKKKVDIIVLELGANDGLRGLKLLETENNLKNIIKIAKTRKIKIFLLGVLMPPNYGKKYTKEFELMYKTISRVENIPYMPFLLEGVAGISKYNQTDGIHPNVLGHELISRNVASFVEKNL